MENTLSECEGPLSIEIFDQGDMKEWSPLLPSDGFQQENDGSLLIKLKLDTFMTSLQPKYGGNTRVELKLGFAISAERLTFNLVITGPENFCKNAEVKKNCNDIDCSTNEKIYLAKGKKYL